MGMEGTGLSVADALALQDRRGDGMFGDGNGMWVFSCSSCWRGVATACSAAIMLLRRVLSLVLTCARASTSTTCSVKFRAFKTVCVTDSTHKIPQCYKGSMALTYAKYLPLASVRGIFMEEP